MRSSSTSGLSVIAGGVSDGADHDLVGAIQRYVDAVVAPLREPAPQIDGFIDRSGMLMLTRGDGTVREAGVVVGRDGKDGATIDDFAAMLAPIKAQLAELAARPEPQPGRDGQPGLPGRDGAPGTDGADGLGFDNLTVEHDGERLITVKVTNGERSKAFPIKIPSMIYREVHRLDSPYEKGDCVSFGGSIWTALRDTAEKPGNGGEDWKLSVKHGRDGRDGRSAFQLAVDAGFKGSEQDWLKSLKGPPGKDGRGFTP
jgi:hypothetical protein